MILASATGIGASFSRDLKGRCMELRMLKQMIYMLRGEIKYTKTPLPEAFSSIAVRMKEPFGSFLEELADRMGKSEGEGLGELWQAEIKTRLSGTHLKREDREQLAGLGEVLSGAAGASHPGGPGGCPDETETVPEPGSGRGYFPGDSAGVNGRKL